MYFPPGPSLSCFLNIFIGKKMCAFPRSPLCASQPLLREPLPCWDGAQGCSPAGMHPPAAVPSSPAWVSEPSKALCFPSLDNRGRNLQTTETRHCSSACLCKSRQERPWLSPLPCCKTLAFCPCDIPVQSIWDARNVDALWIRPGLF